MPAEVAISHPVNPRSYSQADILVRTADGKTYALSDLLVSDVTTQVDEVLCFYCNLPVFWEMPAGGGNASDIRVFTNYHDCPGRQKEFGICNPGLGSLATMRPIFADLAALGVKWVRTDIRWSTVQPSGPNTYNWSSYDSFVQVANEYGIKILFIIDYSVGWANGGQGTSVPPTDPATFAKYAADVVSRYSPLGVKSYEIWNESNYFAFWSPLPDGAAYGRLLKSAYTAMKAIDSSCQVLFSGMANVGGDQAGLGIYPDVFLQQVYQSIGSGYFDAMNYHPYGYNTAMIDRIRQTMVTNGEGWKKLWYTEYGAPTSGTSGQSQVTEQQQADLLVKAVSDIQALPWTGPLFVYSYIDNPVRQPDREGYFGIRRADGSAKPAYYALQAAIATHV